MFFDSDHDYFTGCGSACSDPNVNPQFIGNPAANVGATNIQGSAWLTTGTKASGCVGHQCTD